MATTRPLSAPSKRLAVSITATATSMTLNNIQDWNYAASTSNVLSASGSFNSSTSWPAVLRNDDNSQIEFIELDTTTLSGNTVNITKRGLSYVGGTTANAQTAYAWNANETIVDLGSNPPQLYEQYADKTNNETVTGTWTATSTGQWTFSQFPSKSGGTTPTSSSDFATKAYVDSTVSSSLAYAANIISGFGSTSFSSAAVVYYSSSDQLWYRADGDLTTSFFNTVLGITQSTSNTSGDSINILLSGASTSVSTSLTAGTKYFLGNTAGELVGSVVSVYEVYLGYALSSTKFLFQPKSDNMPESAEKRALAGLAITATAPSSSNTYLTAADSTSAVVTNLIPRRNSTGDVIVNITPQSSNAAASKDYVDTVSTGIETQINDPSTRLVIFDDFLGGGATTSDSNFFGDLSWVSSGGGTANPGYKKMGSSGHPGFLKITVQSAGADLTESLRLTGTTGSTSNILGPLNQPSWSYKTSVRVTSSNVASTATFFRLGLMDGVMTGSATGSSGSMFFQYVNPTSSWTAYSVVAGAVTSVGTAAISHGNFMKFEIIMSSGSSSVNFKVNDTSVGTTTSMSSAFSFPVYVLGTAGGPFNMDVDYFYYKQTQLSR